MATHREREKRLRSRRSPEVVALMTRSWLISENHRRQRVERDTTVPTESTMSLRHPPMRALFCRRQSNDGYTESPSIRVPTCQPLSPSAADLAISAFVTLARFARSSWIGSCMTGLCSNQSVRTRRAPGVERRDAGNLAGDVTQRIDICIFLSWLNVSLAEDMNLDWILYGVSL